MYIPKELKIIGKIEFNFYLVYRGVYISFCPKNMRFHWVWGKNEEKGKRGKGREKGKGKGKAKREE